MTFVLQPERFSFRSRPIAVPGDLRIEWRVSLIVLMLGNSRAKQASLAKLHILNDAIRASRSEHLLDLVVKTKPGGMPWAFRVEPAFGRAVDFVVGDKLAGWTTTAGRSALQLTVQGTRLFDALTSDTDLLTSEKVVLAKYAKTITETMVTAVLSAARKAK